MRRVRTVYVWSVVEQRLWGVNRPIVVSWRTIGSRGIESVGSFLFTSFLPSPRFLFILRFIEANQENDRVRNGDNFNKLSPCEEKGIHLDFDERCYT